MNSGSVINVQDIPLKKFENKDRLIQFLYRRSDSPENGFNGLIYTTFTRLINASGSLKSLVAQ
jgi:hypothetical protein